MTNFALNAAAILLMFVVLPAWMAAGLADYFCHRYSRIEQNSGLKESLLHIVQFGSIGIPVLLALFLEVNAGLFVIFMFCIAAHHAVAFVDVRYANHTRVVAPIEQMVHSFLEILPITAFLLLAVLHWPQLLALFGLGMEPARFAFAKKAVPLPIAYVSAVLGAALLFNLVPYGEEVVRCWRRGRRSD
jgi:hypothetical protein